MSQAVVYLARGLGGGLASATAFLASYAAHPAGAPHDLIVVTKGWTGDGMDGPEGHMVLVERVHAAGASVVDLPDDGFDWGAYMRVAAQIEHDWICCLNTHSRIQADGWLAKLVRAAEQPGIGAAGATASFGTILPTFRFLPPLIRDVYSEDGLGYAALVAGYRFVMDPYHWCKNVRQFPAFPNPHLRSNAFFMRRDLFLQFAAQSEIPMTKRVAFFLESGPKGMTRFLADRGLRVVAVGANGSAYEQKDWAQSGTFWSPKHANLMISDNQTRKYDEVSWWRQRHRERNAWGRPISAAYSDAGGVKHGGR
jgi:hypothetical protein